MRSLFLSAACLAVLGLPAHFCAATPLDEPYAGCGEFVQGVECVLFQADSGGIYLTDGSYDYDVGDRVYIEGILWSCMSLCMQEDACLDVETIEACSVAQQQTTWSALKAIYHSE